MLTLAIWILQDFVIIMFFFRLIRLSLLAQDTDKTIRLLKSSNQPMVKKRQIMQTAFGDYRKKMSDEEKRLRLG